MSTPDVPWTVLGIAPTEDSSAIRRAYAAKLKVTRPEDDRAGFERLREAYELALRWAGNRAKAIAVPSPMEPADPQPAMATPEPLAPPVEKTVVVDPEQQELRRAFVELQSMMASKRGHSAEASRALDTILESPALDNVSIEQRAQHQLAVLLATAIPVSDPLLERAIARFRWERPEAELDITPPIGAILSRVRDLQFLEAMKSDKSPYSPAFRGLQRRKIPVISWVMAHFNKAGAPNEYQLLQLIRVHHPSLLSMLEPTAVAWWDEMASRPRVSLWIIIIGLIIAAVGGFAAAAEEGTKGWLLHMGRSAVVITGLVLWKLYLLDWPRQLIRTKVRLPSVALLAGWLPASIGIILLSMIPAWSFVTWILIPLALGATQWAWTVGWADGLGSETLMRIPLVRALLYNFLPALWWVGAVVEVAPAALQLHVSVLCGLVGTALGLPMAVAVWENRLNARQRWLWLFATCGMTLVAAAGLFFLADHEAWRAVAGGLVILSVLMHRHIAAVLSRRQQELRFGWILACFIGLIVVSVRSEAQLPQFVTMLKGFGSLILSTVLLCMLMGMWNEWRRRIAPFRDDPIHESFYW